MNRRELADWLGLTDEGVAELVTAGLPSSKDGDFDPYVVAQFIEQKGLGQREKIEGLVASLRDVSRAFGVGLQTVKDWRAAGMPGRPKQWDLAEIAAWKKLRDRDSTFNGSAAGAPDSDANEYLKRRLAADARKREAEADRIERINRVADANTLERVEVERVLSELIITARESLLGIPRSMMPRFPRKHARELSEQLEREIERVLQQMANWRPTWEERDDRTV